MPLILGTNSIKDTGYDVANSCRFEASDSQKMVKTLGTPTSTKIGTVSCWVKRGSIGVEQHFFGTKQDGNDRCSIGFDDSAEGELHIVQEDNGSFGYQFKTTARYRDPSAWLHLVLAIDTTQATASNRVKIYINGTQVTDFATETQPSQDTVIRYGISGEELVVGAKFGGGGSYGNFYSGYLAEVVFIDGQQLDPTSFGEFDSDSPNIWKPIDVSGLTFGNNGFYLDFEDSSNLGNDANGGTDLTESNLTALNQTTDTCTNNFCTMNPLTSTQDFNLSQGNLKLGASADNEVINGTIAGTIDNTNSGYYFEYKVNASNLGNNGEGFRMGIVNVDDIMLSPFTSARVLNVTNPALVYQTATNGGASRTDTDIGSASNGDICMVAWKNGKVWLGVNGTFVNSGNPSAGSGEQFSGLSGEFIPFVMCSLTNGVNGSQFNFGNPTFSISSGNADANGFGNFEFAPPTGFFALCTKNIAEIG